MTTMRRDPLIDDYVGRLKAAAGGLPRARRDELVDEIEEHIDAALREDEPAPCATCWSVSAAGGDRRRRRGPHADPRPAREGGADRAVGELPRCRGSAT